MRIDKTQTRYDGQRGGGWGCWCSRFETVTDINYILAVQQHMKKYVIQRQKAAV